MDVLGFTLDDVAYAVPVSRVLEVAARVKITPLAGVADPVLGVIAWREAIAVVVDLRARLGHEPRTPRLDDHFLVVHALDRPVVLVVDRVHEPSTLDLATITDAPVASRHIAGIARTRDGLVLIEDLDAVLAPDEAAAVDRALAAGRVT